MKLSKTHYKRALVLISMFGVLLSYQNCAPVGDVTDVVADSTGLGSNNPLPGTDNDSGTNTDNSDNNNNPDIPPIADEGDPVPPPAIDLCLGNKKPTLYGELLSNNGSTLSVANRDVAIGIAEGSGTLLPNDIKIHASPGEGEAQVLSLKCAVTNGNAIDVDCNNNGFSVVGGKYQAMISANQRNNTQCVSGAVTVQFYVEDSCGARSDQSATFTYNVSDGCLPEQKVVATGDASINAKFGSNLDIDGNYAVVAAPGDDENGNSSGAAYVYQRAGNTWSQMAKLIVSDSISPAGGELSTVAIFGDYIVVGVPYHGLSGAAFVFQRSGNTWTQVQKLLPVNGNASGGDDFGFSVDISSNIIAVGAPLDKEKGVQAGAAHFFRRSGASWNYEAKVTEPGGESRKFFGYSVAVNGEEVAIGAPVSTNHPTKGSGSAYSFKKSGTWQGLKLPYSGGQNGDRFGESIAISNNRIAVGAPKAASSGNARNGVVRIFTGSTYSNEISLTRNTASFGVSVSLDGAQLLVGTPQLNGRMGGAYYYLLDGSSDETKSRFLLLSRDRRSEDQLGMGVSLSNGTAFVGAWIDDLKDSETGTGQPVDNAGSTYFIELP